MNIIPKSIQDLVDELSKLPGVGSKTAQRLTFYLLRSSDNDINELGNSVLNLKKDIKICSTCCNFTDNDPCIICSSQNRDKGIICVVGEPLDVVAFEKTDFTGLYHVLGGVISPVEGVGPDDLYIKKLIDRIKKDKISEVILATNPNLEGETTALYLQKLIQPLGIKITRIARGLPVGGDLEYADEVTLTRSLEGRREY
ncbi:MAG: recombination mediator RecR [Patescibacteria group bacterium]|nr:recombination mediator RecR [Patescibacteria group bacterium]